MSGGGGEHDCPSCDRSFDTRQGLGNHHGAEHGIPITEYERREQADEEHTCPECGTQFGSMMGLKVHYGQSHEGTIAGEAVECSQCGTEKRVQRTRYLEQDLFFCDSDCQSEWLDGRYTGESHPCYQRIERECAGCGAELMITPRRNKRRGRVFCSVECRRQVQSEVFTGEGNPSWQGGPVTVECSYCGASKEVNEYDAEVQTNHFCDRECQGKWASENRTGEDNPLWKGGQQEYGQGWNPRKREQIRERDGYECQICGVSQEEHLESVGRKLDVHHIIPARQFDDPEKRNAPSNLITLCRPCHHKWEGIPLRPVTQ